MPTPVGVARQCLAEAAASVLDEAVTIAKRRNHAQTTSLHTVSALLSLPSSTLRDACARARSSAYSPRLQFRALELSVGVALDRVSVSKSAIEEPPISNSLMAAIKRSQANQRRHPETFHLYQQQLSSNPQNCTSISAVKVELKHFIVSIFDDPMVSRVFDDAGFRIREMKLAILNPLSVSKFSSTTSRPPPLFLCSLRDFETNRFPFPEAATSSNEKFDDNLKRIGEILMNTSRRNPLLIGVCASDAYRNFLDNLNRGETGFLPKEIAGLRVESIENEISDCINRGLSEEVIRMKFKQVNEMVKDCQGPGIVISLGDMRAIVDAEHVEVSNYIVSELKKLLIELGANIWLMGFLAGDSDYSKLVKKFPSIEMDCDLHPMPITNWIGGKGFKSSMMRSFVPFGGLFPMPSELESLRATATQSSKLCNLCNEKCEQQVSALLKGSPTNSVGGNPSSWLQIAECETSTTTTETKRDKTVWDARIAALRHKWSDICQRLHSNLPKFHSSTVSSHLGLPTRQDDTGMGSMLNKTKVTSLSLCVPSLLQNNPLLEQNISKSVVFSRDEIPVQVSARNDIQSPSVSQQRGDHGSSPSVLSVATDLRLGTFSDPITNCIKRSDHTGIQNSGSSRSNEKSPDQVSQSTSCYRNFENSMYTKDLDHPWRVLAEKVSWQVRAIRTISQVVSRCRNVKERHGFPNKGIVWLGLQGPDKVGKRKIAASVAEIVFGQKDHFLCLDLDSHGSTSSINSIIDRYGLEYHNKMSARKMPVDYLAGKLRNHPHSVVLLENVEKADFLVQRSLTRAIKTGKFSDSCGRESNINSNIFFLAPSLIGASEDLPSEFPEEKILEAKNFQMQILVESAANNIDSRNNVTIFPSVNKRKRMDTGGMMSKRACCFPGSVIDLNLPVCSTEEDKGADPSDESMNWLKEVLPYVDENVMFEPFDFVALKEKILKHIGVQIKKVGERKIVLEIERDVMCQILAAAWVTDSENALEDWVEQVLCVSIVKAQNMYRGSCDDLVMKLVKCEGVVEMQACGLRLPRTINL